MIRKLLLGALALTLVVPAAASAHVTLQPSEAPAGSYVRLDVRVPNERDDAGTTKVQVQFPAGFEFASFEPVEGWKAEVKRKGDAVDTVTWSGGTIPPGAFQDFGLSVKIPEKAGETLTFKALQTYEGGEVVRWIGAPDSDEPAPTVAIAAAKGEGSHGADHGGAAPAATTTPAAADDDADDDDGEGAPAAVAWIALALGAAGLGLGLSARTKRSAT